jgi:hypothetical protein
LSDLAPRWNAANKAGVLDFTAMFLIDTRSIEVMTEFFRYDYRAMVLLCFVPAHLWPHFD